MRNYPGILQADEFAIIQDVFKAIATQPWFSRDMERQNKFGNYVIRAYQSGITDKGKLYDVCMRTAQDHFAGAISKKIA